MSAKGSSRRDFLKLGLLAAGATTFGGCALKSQSVEKSQNRDELSFDVVICGGGFGGLTFAKALRELDRDITIALIDKNSMFISCPYSNLWFGGLIEYEELVFDYLLASSKYEYRFIQDSVVEIDRAKKRVVCSSNSIRYSYLVLSPGIDYDYSSLFQSASSQDEAKLLFPPALKSGIEQINLKKAIENHKGGNFIINVPKEEYRCPPAPYERACMIAYYFKQKRLDSKVILIDERLNPQAKPQGFLKSFKELYKDNIIYKNSTKILNIDSKNREIFVYGFDISKMKYVEQKIEFENANIIPENRASKMMNLIDIEKNERFYARLESPSFRSISDSSVYVIGDAQGEYPYPKSAQMANSQAKIVALEIYYRLNNRGFRDGESMPGNVCFSIVNGAPLEGIVVSHHTSYTKDSGVKIEAMSDNDRSSALGYATKEWYSSIIYDMFG